MQYKCRQVREYIINGDSALSTVDKQGLNDDFALEHIGKCEACLRYFELSGEMTTEIRNVSLSPAPPIMNQRVMQAICGDNRREKRIALARVIQYAGLILGYLISAIFIFVRWDEIQDNIVRLAGNMHQAANSGRASINAGVIGSMAEMSKLALTNPVIQSSIILGATVVWAFAFTKARETLRN
jgi:predicted anti-sigma-YlaC factor YlaD